MGNGVSAKVPAVILLSVPQIPVATTLTRTSSGPMVGCGTSVMARGWEKCVKTAAFMAACSSRCPRRARPLRQRARAHGSQVSLDFLWRYDAIGSRTHGQNPSMSPLCGDHALACSDVLTDVRGRHLTFSQGCSP